jgi:DNA modification methylase
MATLLHGDCLEVMKTLPDASVDLTITSPPYYNVKDYVVYETYDAYLAHLRSVFTEVLRLTKGGRLCCVNISNIILPRFNRTDESRRIPLTAHFIVLMEQSGWKFLEDIVWVKPEGAAKNRNGGFFRHRHPVAYKPNVVNEYIYVFQKEGRTIDSIVRSNPERVEGEYLRTNVWTISPARSKYHPAPFPDELVSHLTRYYSFTGDTVLDPYAGTGTTLRVAAQLGRNAIGIEMDKGFYDKWHETHSRLETESAFEGGKIGLERGAVSPQ